VSRQIRELEEELGIEIFVRAGKRLTGLTPPGHAVLPIVERLLQDADNLKRAGLDYSSSQEGRLSIAATHSQARYALPHVVRDFRAMFPQVSLHLHQGSPKQVAEMLLSGEADIGVATEALSLDLQEPVTLQQLQAFPIITYELGYTGRSHIDEAFAREGLKPDVVLMSGNLQAVPTAIGLSTATMNNIRQNLFWAFIYNAALIPVAAGALYPFFGILLSPILAAAAMALSSVFVVSNALRLKGYQPTWMKQMEG
jgi:LysR family cys regulon transcriptional activator